MPLSADYDSTGWVDWMTVQAHEAADGRVAAVGAGREIDGEEDNEQQEVIQAALPGFGSMAAPDDVLLAVKRGEGSVFVVAEPDPPSDAEAGDRWVTTAAGLMARWKGVGDYFEIRGGAATDTVRLCADSLDVRYVARNLDPATLDGITVGYVQATTVKVKAG